MRATVHLKRVEKGRCEEAFLELLPQLERIGLAAITEDGTDVFRNLWIFDSQALSLAEAKTPEYQTEDVYAICMGRACLHVQIDNRGIYLLQRLARLAYKLLEISELELYAMDLGCYIDTDLESHLVQVCLGDGTMLPFELEDADIVDTVLQTLMEEGKKIT